MDPTLADHPRCGEARRRVHELRVFYGHDWEERKIRERLEHDRSR